MINCFARNQMKTVLIAASIAWLSAGYLPAFAQKSVSTKGTSQVRMESNMTKEQARDKAEDLAMINAVENAFGTYCSVKLIQKHYLCENKPQSYD